MREEQITHGDISHEVEQRDAELTPEAVRPLASCLRHLTLP